MPPEAPQFYDCPYCDGQLVPLPDHPDLACTLCGRRFEADMLYAYKDAEDAFVQGHQNLSVMLKRRIEPRRDVLQRETNELYQFAYNKLQTALHYRLPEVYRLAAIEMMADITLYFSDRGMTSRYEAGYWRRLLTEVDQDRALTEITQMLAEPIHGPFDPLKKLLARRQRRRLLNKLRLVDRQITEIEQLINFVEPMHVRRRSQFLNPRS